MTWCAAHPDRARGGARARPGVVLVVALVALVAIEAIALGVIFLATQESRVAAAHDRVLRARLAAEGVAVQALDGWRVRAADPPCAGGDSTHVSVEVTTGDGFRASAMVEPLAGRWHLARAAAIDAAGVRFRTGLLFAAADAAALLPYFPAAVAGAAVGDGVPPDPPPPALPGAADIAAALAVLAVHSPAGALSVEPVTDGAGCLREVPFNWGAPLDPEHVCRRFHPLIHVADSAHVLQGAGQGVAVVSGRLVLGAGTRFDGVILVTGQLVIETGAAIRGAVTVADGGAAALDGTVAFSACAVQRALVASGAAGALEPLPRPRWVPLF